MNWETTKWETTKWGQRNEKSMMVILQKKIKNYTLNKYYIPSKHDIDNIINNS